VSRRNARWEPEAVSGHARDCAAVVARDEARFVLSPSRTSPADRWDYACERRVAVLPSADLHRYVEFVHGRRSLSATRPRARRRVELALNGVTRYRIADALRRTASERLASDPSNAFEWVGLLSRYGGSSVVLSLARENAGALEPFGSVTDLATGQESPAPVVTTSDGWQIEVRDCAPRTMLRMYWPLVEG